MSQLRAVSFSFVFSFIFSANVFAGEKAWKEIYVKEGVTVWQKRLADSPFVAFRGEILVDASIKKVLALLNDQDQKTDWMHQCIENWVVEYKAMGNLVVYNRTHSPFPLIADRDVVAETKLRFDVKAGRIDITAVNIVHPKKGLVKGVVRMEQLALLWSLQFISKTKTKVVYEVQTDPGGWLPAWVVNLVAKGIPYETLVGLREQVHKPYEKSLAYIESSFDWSRIGL
jgi:hypothetical protein